MAYFVLALKSPLAADRITNKLIKMKAMIVVLCLALATANAAPSLLLGGAATLIGPPATGALLKGPAAEAVVKGPDGSIIGAAGQAGAVVAAPQPGGAVSAAIAPGLVGIGLGHGW